MTVKFETGEDGEFLQVLHFKRGLATPRRGQNRPQSVGAIFGNRTASHIVTTAFGHAWVES